MNYEYNVNIELDFLFKRFFHSLCSDIVNIMINYVMTKIVIDIFIRS